MLLQDGELRAGAELGSPDCRPSGAVQEEVLRILLLTATVGTSRARHLTPPRLGGVEVGCPVQPEKMKVNVVQPRPPVVVGEREAA